MYDDVGVMKVPITKSYVTTCVVNYNMTSEMRLTFDCLCTNNMYFATACG